MGNIILILFLILIYCQMNLLTFIQRFTKAKTRIPRGIYGLLSQAVEAKERELVSLMIFQKYP